MKQKFFIIPLLLLVTVACNNNKELAEALYNQAELLYNAGDYAAATHTIDSLNDTYPQEVDIIRRGMLLQCHINQKHYEAELIRLDSAYNTTVSALESLKSDFILVRQGKEQTLANYVLKGYHNTREITHSEIRAHVTENGDFILTSVYFGRGKIGHTGLSITDAHGVNVSTQAIAYDNAKNYRYTSGNNAIEMVSYNLHQCNEFVQAIANSSKRIPIRYTGGGKYIFNLDVAHRNAIAKTYSLAQTMALVDSLQSQRDYSILQLELADRQLMKLQDKAAE